MIIDCISDLHGHYPKLDGGDLLIVAGDLTGRDTKEQHIDFCEWLDVQTYIKKIVIAGNHDNNIDGDEIDCLRNCRYLLDSAAYFEGLKIWGSPWTTTFPGINPHCCAFTVDTDEELQEKYDLIPEDTDILITHNPSFGNYDWIKNRDGTIGPSVGSISLWIACLQIRPKLHVFGHIHEAYGHCEHANGIKIVNSSHVNERYQPVNKPIRIIL
jgi:Icc-related predicted phosphoesterase